MAGKPDDDTLIAGFFDRSLATLQAAANDPLLLRLIAEIAHAIEASMRTGGKLLIAGNGGSAADAQHLAAEFLSRYLVDRRPLPAVAITTDTSVLTALGNDYGFEHVFERQVRGLGRHGRCISRHLNLRALAERSARAGSRAQSRPRDRRLLRGGGNQHARALPAFSGGGLVGDCDRAADPHGGWPRNLRGG